MRYFARGKDAGSGYAQDVRYFARGKDAGSGYVQDVRYFARGKDAGSGYVQDVRYFARGKDAGSDMHRMCGISRAILLSGLKQCSLLSSIFKGLL